MFILDLNSFSELFSGKNLYFMLIASVINAVVIFYASLKFVLSLQQSGYRGKRYFKWLASPETPYLSRLMLLCLMGFLFFLVLNTCFTPMVGKEVASYVGFASYLLFTITYINTESSVNAKVPLRKTKRLVRLCITYVILLFLITFGLFVLVNFAAYTIGDEMVAILRYSLVCGMPILSPYILFLAYGINEPIEELIKRRYVKIAMQKIAKTDVIKIAITGSYGKTSVKEILKTLFSQKYRVLATPKSYNTPMGIAIAVKGLDGTHDIFIAEMGARTKGDISSLAKIVKPDYAVITAINNQHLETFGSLENIKNTKYELIESLGEKGVAFFSADSENAMELFDRFDGEKHCAGINGESNLVTASDITVNHTGTKFTLNFKGGESVGCDTVLLGRHNVTNICIAAAVAYKIGLTPEEIAQGVNRLVTVEHRLELVPNNRNIIIIDDSYNSNVDGVKAAMEVLDTFKGRKIVLTPGLVELGKDENVVNYEVGKLIASHADIVFVIGKHNAEMLINGLTEKGFNKENILFAKSLNKGNQMLNEILTEGDVVLFENDLPDNYN